MSLTMKTGQCRDHSVVLRREPSGVRGRTLSEIVLASVCCMSIEACGLTKRYGDKTAVDDLSFAVRPGMVTGFLGPNGAGKTTTMRLIVGLDAPTAGSVTVNGRPYAAPAAPMRE